MIRILISGSRNWVNRVEFRFVVSAWIGDHRDRLTGDTPDERSRSITIVHGAARGIDTFAGEFARSYSMVEEAHPADWTQFGRSAGHRRNAEMVALGGDVLMAFPIGPSPGTRGCVRAARLANIPVIVTEGVRT